MSRLAHVILIVTVLLVAGCIPPGAAVPTATLTPAANLPNPASVHCEEQGNRLEIRTDDTGAQAGVCIFPDGTECDEWAYFRGECGPGTPAAGPTSTPAPARTERATAPAPESTTYTSTALGISFSYLPEQNGQTIKVLEQGDTIYVYPAEMEATAGQWVQVFPKEAGESLVDAITRAIMPGYPAEDCRVTPLPRPTGAAAESAGYEYAGIAVRRDAGEDEETVLARWKTCPQPYTVVGGIGYFMADPAHPTRFLFFSIGQYGIRAGDEQAWQGTVRFE
jgi:putative hemolysin